MKSPFFTAVVCVLPLLWGCSSTPKRLTYAKLDSAAMGEKMEYAVYTPRDFKKEESLPLVIFLHGGGDSANCFDKADVGKHLDQAIAEGTIPKVVIAVPQGDMGFWENWADGSHMYRDWVLKEMLPEVQKQYGTQACPEGCHVMGISMGGFGALRMALKTPEYFSSVTALSAPIFDTDQMLDFKSSFWWSIFVPSKRIWGKSRDRDVVAKDDLYVQWKTQQDLKGLSLRIGWGTKDKKGVISTNEHFERHLKTQQIEHQKDIFEGNHDWDPWIPAILRALAEQVGGAPATVENTMER